MSAELSARQTEALHGLCDTIVPSIARAEDPDGFWARKASDLGIDHAAAEAIGALPEEANAGLRQLLDVLHVQGIAKPLSQRSREQILRNVSLASREAAGGVAGLANLIMLLYYGAPDPQTGQNPNWRTFGYPGPISSPPSEPKTITPLVPEGEELTLEADVCVVGSGAGGGVIAGTLAQQGLKVVVLEAGGYFNEADFPQLELWAYQNLYYRGGPTPTADQNVSLQAGFCLGGGTTVNWTNCLRTWPHVREQWARDFGLEGLDSPDYERHLDAVMERISANDRCSDLNGPHQRIVEGAEKLGYHHHACVRNTDESRYSPEAAAYMGFGDQSGSKQGTFKTYLQDAFDAGADILVRCNARRVLVEDGRAAGVEALYADPETGRSARVSVRAPQVVVAAGALESPALLLRSEIGGPAVGKHLRLHPSLAMSGLYDSDQQAWWGTPQSLVMDEFRDVEDGYGFLVEGVQYTTGLTGAAIPWLSGEEHKDAMSQFGNVSTFVAVNRDHGGGEVTLDPHGEALHTYAITDELDQRVIRRSLAEMIRIHEAAGAREIWALAAGSPRWTRGEDLEAFIDRVSAIPLAAGGQKIFSAHQMGSCRMGSDPQTSVAGPFGELHDTAGVWIGDASAFPTPSGTNPMISIMGLAHRTAEAIAATAGASTKQSLATASS